MRGKQVQKRRRIPEALGNRLCGVWPYVVMLVLNAAVHAALFFAHGATPQSLFRLSFSFVFFIYPLYYVTDTLWSLRPSVYGILSGRIRINRKYYMNTAQKEIAREALLPVTVSVPVYLESNETIFQTLRESLAAARRYRKVSGKDANVVVSDDGLAPLLGGRCAKEKAERLVQVLKRDASALTQRERKAAERIQFYREHGVSFVARPQAGRAGLFKKGSNLNYTLRLGNAVSDGASLDSLLRKDGAFAGGYAEGDIATHEIILLLDKDSGVKEEIIEAILPEFAIDGKLAYVQCATKAGNLHENYYTYATGHQINNLFHNIWPCKALQGFFVPLVGHNAFLRKSLLEKSGLWSENRVSEDYDKALCFYSMGYHGKYAHLVGLEFTEYASRTFTEETGKQRRYAYGLFEMIFDGIVTPGKVRACDSFFMVLYFFSVVNQTLLLPTVLLESYFGNIHLLWAGFLLCTLCFIILPLLRGFAVRHHLPEDQVGVMPYTLVIAVSFVGHSFSFLAGACRYLANKLKENKTPFPSTDVDQLGYSLAQGMKLLARYIRRNPLFLVIAFLCLDRGIFLLTRKGLEAVTALTYGYILFCAVLVPVLLTPQLFSGLGMKLAEMRDVEVGSLKRRDGKDPRGMRRPSHQSGGDKTPLPLIIEEGAGSTSTGIDVERFLASYQETLQASLPGEGMPEELLADYVFESCLRKDPESRKELYLLCRKKDGAKALLRITKDYPEEDALEEARLLRRLDHPGIPKVYASYEQDGKRYLIREYIEGRTLFEIVSAGGILGAQDVFGIALKLADILIYLHAQTPPVIHRDIKPQNIIVGRDGSIHLIDFGIARVHKQARRQDTSVILTLDYASPEQYGFEQTTPLSDIYSFGVVLLFLATGRTVRSGLEAQIVSNRLRNLIEQCIVFNPKARIRSAEEIRAYLMRDTNRRTPKQRRRLSVAAGLLAAAACLSALSYGLGFAVERGGAAERGYKRGYEVGYTDGYDAAPVFYRGNAGDTAEGGTSFGNMSVAAGAFAASGEGDVFYIADGGIWRMSANGTESELLVQDGLARALSYDNGWLYYSSGGRIVQTNIYTLETDVLCEFYGDLYVVEGHFYIRAEDELYLLDAETGETTAAGSFPGSEFLHMDGENLYFVNGGDRALYRSDLSGENQTKLAEGDCQSACLFGGDLFCIVYEHGAGRLIRMDADTGEATVLLEARASMLNVMEDGICFLDLSDGTINRCSFDGRVRERVSGNRAQDFNIAGGWILYHNEEDGGRLWCVRFDGANDHPVSSGR